MGFSANFFRKAARTLFRTPGEHASLRAAWNVRTKLLSYSLLSLSVVTLFGSVFLERASHWNQIEPEVLIPSEAWLIDGKPRSNPKQERAFTRQAAEYTLKTEIPVSVLQSAHRLKATHLILGLVNGTYSIDLDGAEVLQGTWADNEPIVIQVAPSRLALPKSLPITIHIQNIGHGRPDQLNYAFGDILGEGFATKARATEYRRLKFFSETLRPFTLFLLNAVFGFILFILWWSQREKQEYFYLSLYALVSALFQTIHIDLVTFSFAPHTIYFANTALVFFEGAFGLLLGLSFARTRSAVFFVTVPLTLLAPLTLLGLTSEELYRTGILINNWVSPVMYLVGSAACFLQIPETIHVRRQRLLLFGVGLLALASLSFLESFFWYQLSIVQHFLGYRVGHFSLILYLGSVALREYREQQLLVEKIPVSSYHRRLILPERVSGAVLMIDLKNAEWLFRKGAELGDAALLSQHCISQLWGAVDDSMGTVLQAEGDAIRAFFDESRCPDPISSALKACDEMRKRIGDLDARFRKDGWMSEAQSTLCFRGGLTKGEIKPIWQKTGDATIAAWAEAGTSNPFVETARLMELERTLPENTPASRVLVSQSLVSSGLKSRFKEELTLTGKHGKAYACALYEPA